MAVDAGIYNILNTKGIDLGGMINEATDRQNRLAQLAQQQQLGAQQLQTGAIGLQQAQQSQSDEEKLRQMYQESGGDVSSMVQNLRSQGLHTQADQLVKSLKDQQIANYDVAAKRNTAAHDVAGQVFANPSNWQQTLDTAVKSGSVHPEDAQHMAQTFGQLQDPDAIKKTAGSLMQDTKAQNAQLAEQFKVEHPIRNPEKVIDAQQNIWFTDNQKGLVPAIDPNTKKQMKAPLPASIQMQQQNLNPDAIEPMAQMIASGKAAMPTGRAALTGAGAATVKRALEINPDLQGQSFKTSQSTETAFAKGKEGQSVRSFNVSLEHLDTLGNLADALNNNDTRMINSIGNQFSLQSGKPAPTNFNAAKKIVGDEIVKAIVGSGGGVADREEAAKTIDAANSPAQLKGVISTYKELMAGQLTGLKNQYVAGGGKQDFDKTFLTDKSRAMLAARHPQAPSQNPLSVTDPNGGVHNFPNAEAAANFRKAIGQ